MADVPSYGCTGKEKAKTKQLILKEGTGHMFCHKGLNQLLTCETNVKLLLCIVNIYANICGTGALISYMYVCVCVREGDYRTETRTMLCLRMSFALP